MDKDEEVKDTIKYEKPKIDSLIQNKDSVISEITKIKQKTIKKINDLEKEKEGYEKEKKVKDEEIKIIKEKHKKKKLYKIEDIDFTEIIK